MRQDSTLEMDRLYENAEEAGRLLKTLANQDRLLLLCRLSQGEQNVGELQNELGIPQPTLSQQLAVLRREALVTTRRDGKQIYYRISSDQAMAVIQTLYEQFCV